MNPAVVVTILAACVIITAVVAIIRRLYTGGPE